SSRDDPRRYELSLQWYSDDEVLAGMLASDAAARLEAIGETDMALRLRQSAPRSAKRASSFGIFDMFSGATKPWMHATHVFGFLPRSQTGEEGQEILPPGEIKPDESLRNGRINITLNRLRIAEYPGGGRRQILFDFSGQNKI